jgi:hypothetical protein
MNRVFQTREREREREIELERAVRGTHADLPMD